MNSLTLTLKPKRNTAKKIIVEMDADRLERLAANFGMFNPDFLASVKRAERDYEAGRVRKIHSLRELIG